MSSELDYYITEMKAGRLRILYGLTTPQTWTVDYVGGQFLKRRYDDYTGEPIEDIVGEDEVRTTIELLGADRIWGADVQRAARKQAGEGEPE